MTKTDRIETIRNELLASYLAQKSEEFEGYLMDAASDSASPIEQLMAMSLVFLISMEGWHGGETRENRFFYGVPTRPLEDHLSAPVHGCGVEITPEVPIGKYRADFLVRYAHWRGGVVFGAIECDGHDHHNLTKEQAQHDRERDRFFQSAGVTILRYPGSEIWRAPLKAGADALGILEKLAEQPTARRWRDE